MGARYWLFTILGECVVSSEIGTTPKIETHGCIKIIIINFICLGEVRWGKSPPPLQGERPKFLFLVRHVSNNESSRKCRKACETCVETSEIRNPNKHTGFDKENSSEYWRVV